MGIPSITYLKDWDIPMPDMNCGNTVESLTNKLEQLLNSDLKKFSDECYEYSKFHSYETVGKMWGKIYDGLA